MPVLSRWLKGRDSTTLTTSAICMDDLKLPAGVLCRGAPMRRAAQSPGSNTNETGASSLRPRPDRTGATALTVSAFLLGHKRRPPAVSLDPGASGRIGSDRPRVGWTD